MNTATNYVISVHVPDFSSRSKVVYNGKDREVALEIAKAYARAGRMVWFEEIDCNS